MASSKGYGAHPTIYGALSNDELISLYRETSWYSLDERNRQQLLQETVNRSAALKGELGSCEVKFANLDSSVLGVQHDNVIEVNHNVFAKDLYTHTYNGHIIEEPVFDSNMRALETILHEDIHAWQNQCINGIIQCSNSDLLAEYKANDFTVSVVLDENGKPLLGSHYLSGMTEKTGYYMYYFQSTERDAHLYSEQQTIEIMKYLEAKYGTDKSLLTYQRNILLNGFQSTHQKGQAVFGNNNFDKDINQVLLNQFYGTDKPVDLTVKSAVQNEMTVSYQAQMKVSIDNKEISAERPYRTITVEDYDDKMRTTVNAFYEHTCINPTMNEEKPVAQTSQTNENRILSDSSASLETRVEEFSIEDDVGIE